MADNTKDTQLVAELAQACVKYGLEGKEFLEEFSVEALAEIYNGTGAEWMHESIRATLDTFSEDLLPSVLIHDVEFKKGGTREDFYQANERLRRNGVKLAKAKYGWWRLRRYRLIAQANAFADVCHVTGWFAFNKTEA